MIGLIGEYVLAESIARPLPVRIGNRDPQFAPHNVYRTQDSAGRELRDFDDNLIGELHETWLAVAVDSDDAWRALRSVIVGRRLDDVGYGTAEGCLAAVDEIDAAIGEWAAGREPNEAAAELQAAGASAAPVLSPLMLVHDEHLAGRGFYPSYDHADAGRCLTTRPVWRLARRPFEGVRPAPRFGEHNRELLSRLAGYSDAEIDALERDGVIAGEPLAD